MLIGPRGLFSFQISWSKEKEQLEQLRRSKREMFVDKCVDG